KSCPIGQAHFTGEPGCTVVGQPCPSGDFPAVPSGVTVRYVRAGALGGDGSLAAPYGSLASAVAGAAPGTVLALAAGTLREVVQLPAGLRVLGACAERTVLEAPVLTDTFTVTGLGVSLENLRVRGYLDGVKVLAGASLKLEGVVLQDHARKGLLIAGGQAEAHDLVVAATVGYLGADSAGIGVQAGGQLTLRRGVVSGNQGAGIALTDAGTLATLEDVAIHGTIERNTSQLPIELSVFGNAQVRVARAYLGENDHIGVWLVSGASAELDQVVIREVRGDGVIVAARSTLSLRRSQLHELGGALLASNLARMSGDDLVLHGTRSLSIGVLVHDRTTATLRRSILQGARQVGIGVFDATASIALEDVDVSRITESTCASNDCPAYRGAGAALGSYHGATLTARRFRVSG
ncbi:MAG TPA: right-handed parallel beta-helix repeat-containing protein, partial [Gemmatimonadales bacterium]|nr:right-handed parallel beta-helix repeat-containing protein [Gemmatimonadales bacterium]